MNIGRVLRPTAAIVLGYGLGTIPTADIVNAWVAPSGPDLRSGGSHNPGALNVGRSIGKRWGAAVFAVDVAKGAGAALVGRRLGGPSVANVAAAAAVGGHTHPIGREGGKGVATSIGQVIGTFPAYLPLDVAVAAMTVALPRWTQRTWAATAIASGVWVSSSAIAWSRRWPTGTDNPAPAALPIAAAVSSAMIAGRFLREPLVDGMPIEDTASTSGAANPTESRLP